MVRDVVVSFLIVLWVLHMKQKSYSSISIRINMLKK